LRGCCCVVLGPPGEAKLLALAVIEAAERAGSDCSSARRHLRTGEDEVGIKGPEHQAAEAALDLRDQSDATSEDSDATVAEDEAFVTASEAPIPDVVGRSGGCGEGEQQDTAMTGGSAETENEEEEETTEEESAEEDESEEELEEELEEESEEESEEEKVEGKVEMKEKLPWRLDIEYEPLERFLTVVASVSAKKIGQLGADGAELAEALCNASLHRIACGDADQTTSLPTRIAFCTASLNRDFQVKVALAAQCLLLLPYRNVGAAARRMRRFAASCGRAAVPPAH